MGWDMLVITLIESLDESKPSPKNHRVKKIDGEKGARYISIGRSIPCPLHILAEK